MDNIDRKKFGKDKSPTPQEVRAAEIRAEQVAPSRIFVPATPGKKGELTIKELIEIKRKELLEEYLGE